CEVEIDRETGTVRVDRYVGVDDVGVAFNPVIVHGQVHGGVVQGLGQVLMENAVYDRDGQLLSGSFMDYAMPHASDIPLLTVSLHEVPARSNPIGVKGAGESGVTGSIPAIANAVADALAQVGVVAPIDMPFTAEKMWRALNG
ncbi:MAG: xanthine dehydrogenase family protein molybdopterin-binding subunit, partial [Janthinobacterium lividum]